MPYPKPPFPPDKVPGGTIPGPARRRMIDYIKAVLGQGMEWIRPESDDVIRTYYHEALLHAGVVDPSIGEKIGGLIPGGAISAGTAGIKAASDVMSVGEFLAKLATFLLNPVRMGEAVVGTVLVIVGINGITKGKGPKAVKSAANKAASVAAVVK